MWIRGADTSDFLFSSCCCCLVCSNPRCFPTFDFTWVQVRAATDVHPELPDRMSDLFERDEVFHTLANDIGAVQDFVRRAVEKHS